MLQQPNMSPEHGGVANVERYWEYQPCAPQVSISSVKIMRSDFNALRSACSLNGMQAGPFSITIACIQAVQYKPGLVYEPPQYLPPPKTEAPKEPLEKRRMSSDSVLRTREIVKRFSPARLAAKMRRTVHVVGGPDAEPLLTTNPFVMDLGKLNFPGPRDWDNSEATAGPNRSAQDRRTIAQPESAAARKRNRLRKARTT